MKNCIEIRGLLSLYLDNELHENDRKQVVKHLENCSDCKAELEQLKNVVEAISDIEEISYPQDFNIKLHEKLIKVNEENKPIKQKRRLNYFGWGTALVAGFALIFVGINMGFFNQIINPNTKLAYVNDTNLQTVTKDEMANINKPSIEIKGENNTQIETANKSTTNNKSTIQSTTNQKDQFQRTDSNSNIALGDQSDTTSLNSERTETIEYDQQIAPVSYVTLNVSNTTDSVSQIMSTVKNNGGQMQENSSDRSLTINYSISIPKDSYNEVMNSFAKLGTVEKVSNLNETMPQSVGIMAIPPTSTTKDAYSESQSQNQNVTIELQIHQR